MKVATRYIGRMLRQSVNRMLMAIPLVLAGSYTNAAANADALSTLDFAKESGSVAFTHSQEGWKSTGISIEAGSAATIIGEGTVNIGTPKPVGPSMFLWARIGADGPAFNVTSDRHTFEAEQSGVLYLAVRPAGVYWMDRRGSFPADFGGVPEYPVEAQASVVVWSGSAEVSLAANAAQGDPLWVDALEKHMHKPQLPEGFEYLWYLGQSTVFEAYADTSHQGVRGLPTNDAGIIRKAVDLPLTADTTVAFDWRYAAVPGEGPETEPQHHDYLSIAIEFENGQDITWFWSGHLETGHEFTCPLPWWDQRETHIVLQSGDEGLGEWHRHQRFVRADYASAVGGDIPQRIVGIWFINAGVFGDKPGDAVFANVSIKNGDNVVNVFGDPR